MSKILKGPPGSPLPLCSGTSMVSIKTIDPFFVVPHVGQTDEPLPQLLARKNDATTAARTTTGNIFDLMEHPPAIFAWGPTSIKRPSSPTHRSRMRSCRSPYQTSKFSHQARSRCLLEQELNPLQCHKVIAWRDPLHAWILELIHVEIELQQ